MELYGDVADVIQPNMAAAGENRPLSSLYVDL
jgi:hypothetical protein